MVCERRRVGDSVETLRPAVPVLAASLLASCVFPSNLVSGVELSWYMPETQGFGDEDDVDGEAEPLTRTCEGADVRAFVVTIDDADEDRSRELRFDCETGFQTPDDFVAEVSDIFLDLRPGKYTLEIRVIASNGAAMYQEVRDVNVRDQRARLVRVAIEPEPVDLELEVVAPQACGNLGGWLRYEDPARDLADYEDPVAGSGDDADPAEPTPVVYREDLASDRGLRLDGTSRPCDDLAAGLHTFTALDPGRYVLALNGLGPEDCELPVVLEPGAQSVRITLDLANPPC